jgi:phosphoglycerate dehydrogenase-like enzyme
LRVSSSSPRVVCISYAPLAHDRELERLRALEPRIEGIAAPYVEEESWRRSRHLKSIETLRRTAPPIPDETRAALARAEAWLAFDVPVDARALAPNLKWLHSITAGIDHLAGAGLRGSDITVSTSSGIAAPSVAEFVLGRLLMVWKRFPEQAELQRGAQWSATYGRAVRGKTVAVVGYGAIGRAVAKLLKAFDARVIGIRRSGGESRDCDEIRPPRDLHSVLGRSDAVIVTAPATAETFHLIDREALAAMRPGAILVNVARGSLVDEAALTEALRSGHLGAAALDVFETEPLPTESPLWNLPNCFISSHCAPSLEHYSEDVLELFVANLRRYLDGGPLINVAEPPA